MFANSTLVKIQASDISDGTLSDKNTEISIKHIIIDHVRLTIDEWKTMFDIIHKNVNKIETLSIDIAYGTYSITFVHTC